MPIYEYRCADCDIEFEALVRSIVSPETVSCPQCNGQHVAKAISLFGAVGGGRTSSQSASSSASCGPVG